MAIDRYHAVIPSEGWQRLKIKDNFGGPLIDRPPQNAGESS
jgi:hypothetical protein